MADRTQRQIQDHTRIDIEQEYALRYWSQEIGVTEEELKMAVRAAGTNADTVRRYLDRH